MFQSSLNYEIQSLKYVKSGITNSEVIPTSTVATVRVKPTKEKVLRNTKS